MPRQRPHPQLLPRPRWRNRLAGWLREVAETLDPTPFGLDLTDAPDFWAERVRAAAARTHASARRGRRRAWHRRGRPTGSPPDHPAGMAPGRIPPAPQDGADLPAAPAPPPQPAARRAAGPKPAEPLRPTADLPGPARPAGGPPLVRPRARPADTTAAGPPVTPAPAAPGQRPGLRVDPGPDAPLVRPRNPFRSRPATRPDPGLPEVARPEQTPPWSRGAAGSPAAPGPEFEAGPSPLAAPRLAAPRLSAPRLAAPRPSAPQPSALRATALEPTGRPAPRPAGREEFPGDAGSRDPLPALAGPSIPVSAPAFPADAVLPEELWPELPPRLPAPPAMPDPVRVLRRQERLAAEQAAT